MDFLDDLLTGCLCCTEFLVDRNGRAAARFGPPYNPLKFELFVSSRAASPDQPPALSFLCSKYLRYMHDLAAVLLNEEEPRAQSKGEL